MSWDSTTRKKGKDYARRFLAKRVNRVASVPANADVNVHILQKTHLGVSRATQQIALHGHYCLKISLGMRNHA